MDDSLSAHLSKQPHCKRTAKHMAANSDSLFVLRILVEKDFKIRYRNMSLGVFWSFVNPLVMMSVLTFVFTQLMPSGRDQFALFVLTGLLPYNFFSLNWQCGTTSIVDNSSLINKVPFQRALLPIAVVCANSIHYMIQLALLLLASAIFVGVNRYWFWLPVIVGVQFVFVCGVVLTTSALNVFIRDTRYVVESVTLVLFFMLPIFYGFEDVGVQWAWLYEINPLAAVILIMRSVLLEGAPPMTMTLVKLVSITVITFAVGLRTFSRLQRRFSDYL
jgi:ABC-type polysaccharide/polyol phosphate export permease